jgi:hypothetical protein
MGAVLLLAEIVAVLVAVPTLAVQTLAVLLPAVLPLAILVLAAPLLAVQPLAHRHPPRHFSQSLCGFTTYSTTSCLTSTSIITTCNATPE